jgi:hypothetical protein
MRSRNVPPNYIPEAQSVFPEVGGGHSQQTQEAD